MRVVFCGTPDFAVPSLQALVDAGVDIPLVVSQPDRVRARRARPTPSPVRARAQRLDLPTAVLERGKAARTGLYQRILDLDPDVVAVVAFGHIVREPLLSGPRLGCVNVHASLLPRWRGPAPIHTAIVAGDERSGVCTMHLAAGVDTGDVYLREAVDIGPDETAGELHDRLAELGAPLLVRTLLGLDDGSVTPTPQDGDGVTHAPMLDRAEGSVDFDAPARRVHDRIRGMDPWPGTTVRIGERALKIAGSSAPGGESPQEAPGTVIAVDERGMSIACRDGSVLIRRVQAAGKRPLPPIDFARGHDLRPGMQLRPTPDFELREPRT